MQGKIFKAMIQEMLDTWPYFNDVVWKFFLQEDGRCLYEKSLKHCQNKFPNYVDEIRGMAEGCGIPFEKVHLQRKAEELLRLFNWDLF